MFKKKNISIFVSVIALVLYFMALLFSFLGEEAVLSNIEDLLGGSLVIILGVSFIASKSNNILRNIGYSLLTLFAVMVLGSSIFVMSNDPDAIIDPLSLLVGVLLLISVLIFFIQEILNYFGFSRSGVPTYEGGTLNKVNILKRWNKLTTENLITPENFERIKELVLESEGVNPKLTKLNEMHDLIENGFVSNEDLAKVLLAE